MRLQRCFLLCIISIPLLTLTTAVFAQPSRAETSVGIAQAQYFPGQSSSAEPGSIFYFHYGSMLYQSNNASIVLLEEANLNQPVEAVPQVVEVASGIRNATTIFGTVWIGTVSWVSQPLAQPTVIHGSVLFEVWLSTNDTTPAFSGVGAGIAVLDQQNQTVGNYAYTYSYAHGSILTASAREYNFNVDMNREIAAGQRFVFAVGVGSTAAGWRMKVYFDSAQYPSQAQLPSTVLVMAIPEFNQGPMVLMAVITVTVSFSLLQRRLRSRRDGSKR